MSKLIVTAATFVIAVSLASAAAASSYSTAVLADNPIAYYQFEDGNLGDNVDGAIAVDSAGPAPSGNHPGLYGKRGVGDGVDLVSGVPGIGGLAAHFAGGSGHGSSGGDYVLTDTMGNLGSGFNTVGVTFEFWFQDFQTGTLENRIFGVYNERPGGSSDFHTQLTFGVYDPNGTTTSQIFGRDDDQMRQIATFDDSVVNIKDGAWHHIAVIIQPSTTVPDGTSIYSVYADGQAIPLNATFAEAASNFVDFDKPLAIGGENQFGSNGVRGMLVDANLDEFAIYNYPLTQSQVQAHYAAAVPPSAPGDFDGDGDVDGADFVAWQTNFPKASGATLAEGDADGDGDVDGADFVVWQTNFPFTPGPGAAVVAEPSSCFMLIISGLVAAGGRRRRLRRAA